MKKVTNYLTEKISSNLKDILDGCKENERQDARKLYAKTRSFAENGFQSYSIQNIVLLLPEKMISSNLPTKTKKIYF